MFNIGVMLEYTSSIVGFVFAIAVIVHARSGRAPSVSGEEDADALDASRVVVSRNELLATGILLLLLSISVARTNINPPGMSPEPYGGTTARFQENGWWVLQRSTDLELKYDPDMRSKVWMAQNSKGRWYPLFMEQIE